MKYKERKKKNTAVNIMMNIREFLSIIGSIYWKYRLTMSRQRTYVDILSKRSKLNFDDNDSLVKSSRGHSIETAQATFTGNGIEMNEGGVEREGGEEVVHKACSESTRTTTDTRVYLGGSSLQHVIHEGLDTFFTPATT